MQKYKKYLCRGRYFWFFFEKNARVVKPLRELNVDSDMLTEFYCLFNTFFNSSISGKAFLKFSGISSEDL